MRGKYGLLRRCTPRNDRKRIITGAIESTNNDLAMIKTGVLWIVTIFAMTGGSFSCGVSVLCRCKLLYESAVIFANNDQFCNCEPLEMARQSTFLRH
jgi:hypothetical protein